MSVTVNLTEKEILDTPNDYDLGEKVRKMYWELKELETEEERLRDMDGESYMLVSEENGLVMGIHLPNNEYTENGYDKCVVCGKVSPYKTTTNIDLRIGYVEGGGQGCFQPSSCN